MTIADELLSRKDALLSKIESSSDPAFANYLAQLAAILNIPFPAETVTITNAQTSAPFTLLGKLNFAHIGTTSLNARNGEIEYTPNGIDWYKTGVQFSANFEQATRLTPDDLTTLIPFCGRKDILRVYIDGADTISITWFSSN